MAVAAITRLRLRRLYLLPLLLLGAFRSRRQALASDGCLAADVRMIGAHVFWTRSLWRDAGAMREFMRGGAHRTVMPRLIDWCDEASLADWEHDALPKWGEAEGKNAQRRTAVARALSLAGAGPRRNPAGGLEISRLLPVRARTRDPAF